MQPSISHELSQTLILKVNLLGRVSPTSIKLEPSSNMTLTSV